MWIVDELENAIDIVELVSKYVKLKKSWANYKAVCPFPGHTEKTPSFMVSPVKQLAYCFGCHKGWGALKFIMDIENTEFKDALQILAWITGRKLEWFDSEKYKVQKNIYNLYKDSVNYYKKALENNSEAQKYLFNRGLKKEDFKKFNFGFSDSGISLFNYLKDKWYNDKQIWSSNIFVNLSGRKDKFIWRIIFPIQNLRWDFIAFTARIINSWEPKYLNSPASELYDKSEILYWLFQAKKSIVDKNYVIIVEWQMDAISLQSAWFINTVAISGTALTEKHLIVLKRITHKIYLSFDWDSAWKKATKLALETIKNKWFEVKIIDIPNNSDPDSLLKTGEDFEKFIKNALSPIGYYINKSDFDITSIEDKKKLLEELLEILKSYLDRVEQDFYLQEISRILNIKIDIVYDNFIRINRQKVRFWVLKKQENSNQNFTLEEIAIWYILLDSKYKDFIEKNIIFENNIWSDLKEVLENTKIIEKFELAKRDKLRAISMKISSEQEQDSEKIVVDNLVNFTKKLNKFYYKNIVSELKQKMELGDDLAFLKYSKIIKKAKKFNIK